ncbi:MAG: rhomboid family intramembrane serine protease [Saprospiraceae bacterium]|jgi:membrane associated rhomboid family serine protease|nr:rhomboid family intramembrane serine protease [Saprospiraceae bacterium]MBL0026929.1 rhomboid family intramembrane serine protease [Saprospiraceae bacterium]
MFFPIGDTQVSGGYKPIVSYSFIVINVLVFILQVSTPGNLICQFSAIPIDIIKGEGYFTLLSSIFMHGSWMHLIGNMLFLWVFADNIEAKIGSVKFLIFYLAGGFFASFAHIYFSTSGAELSQITCLPCSQTNPCAVGTHISAAVMPSLGASGAISAVMGAYLLMFPKSQIKVLVLILFRSFYVPALLFLGLWFIQQLFSGMGSLGPATAEGEGVAWWAHIGGFVFGLIAGVYLKSFVKSNIDYQDDEFVS